MDNGILIKGGRVLTFPEGLGNEADVLIQGGVIQKVEKGISALHCEIVDASGCIVSPGLVEMHAHLREPGMEYKEDIRSGSLAASCGGYSAVFCMPNTKPCIDSGSIAEFVFNKGFLEGRCMVLPHGAITMGRNGEVLSPMGEMRDCQANVIGFSDDGNPVSDSEVMRRAMEYAKGIGAVIISHSEDRSLSEGGQMNESRYSTLAGLSGIPTESETAAVYRDILLAEKTGANLHLAHLSVAESIKLVRKAKQRGVKVTCEVTPHHFSLDDSRLLSYDANMKVNPPLRSRSDVEAVIEGLADGTVDVIATDHAPHASHEKEVEFDHAEFGIIGMETSLALTITMLVETGVLSIEQALAKLSAAPSSIMKMDRWGYQPVVKDGASANLVVFDPGLQWEVETGKLHSRSRNTAFRGWKLTGKPVHTVFRGRIVVKDGEPVEEIIGNDNGRVERMQEGSETAGRDNFPDSGQSKPGNEKQIM